MSNVIYDLVNNLIQIQLTLKLVITQQIQINISVNKSSSYPKPFNKNICYANSFKTLNISDISNTETILMLKKLTRKHKL